MRSNLRTIATALESYDVAENDYPPNDGKYTILPVELTTPVAHLTSSLIPDPFTVKDISQNHGILVRYYTYHKIVDRFEAQHDTNAGRRPPNEAVDLFRYNPGALQKYGRWKLLSFGPDHQYSSDDFSLTDNVLLGSDILYDPTNGTTSWGNIIRTQNSTVGEVVHF